MAQHPECTRTTPHGYHRFDAGYLETWMVSCEGLPTQEEINNARRALELREAKAEAKHARKLARIKRRAQRYA